jgi:CRP/FNR family transcriptional regulator, anaerobic regulatory protein
MFESASVAANACLNGSILSGERRVNERRKTSEIREPHFMNARLRPAIVEAGVPQVQPLCSTCQSHEFNWCRVALAAQCNVALIEAASVDQSSSHTVAARRIICREQDLYDAVPIICDGWAASVVTLSDGSRQILSFLLPGDLVSTTLLFEARPNCLVEAITEVRFRTFKRSYLKTLVFERPDLFGKLAQAWIEEKDRADQLIIDLGRRTADERIARLILNLAERLAKRGTFTPAYAASGMEMDFPLRQHHIADATGLTPVHVSKVLSEFRRDGLIKISDRALTILDPAGFRRVAQAR